MAQPSATLFMVCGKAASGKSTLTADLGEAPKTVVLSEDEWLSALFGDQLSSLQDYVRCSTKLRRIIGPHVIQLLLADLSVVLDFQANTLESRAWMLEIAKQAGAHHELHYINVADAVCKERLRRRNLSGEHPFTVNDEQFDRLAKHFVEPTEEEGLNIVFLREG